MTRGNPGQLQRFDPEIDRTFHILVRHFRNLSLYSISLDTISLSTSEHSPSVSENFNSVLADSNSDSNPANFHK